MRRIATALDESGVTHVLPMLSILAPFILGARQYCKRPPKVLITFQGYKVYTSAAREAGLELQLYEQLREAVRQSDFPAVAVSKHYADLGFDGNDFNLYRYARNNPALFTDPTGTLAVLEYVTIENVATAYVAYDLVKGVNAIITSKDRFDCNKIVNPSLPTFYSGHTPRHQGLKHFSMMTKRSVTQALI